jgi:Uma2 family endonuclease
MATAVTDTRYTPAELLTLPDTGRYELTDGQLVERNGGAKSSYLAARLLRLLGLVTEAQGLGLLFGTDCGYQIVADDPSRVRYADGSFIQRGRWPGDAPPEGHCRISSDLAIEAVSPNDLARAIEEQVEQWLAAGVRLVWILYPDTHRLHIHRYDGTVSKLRSDADEVLSGEDVVPGFQCRVAEIFQEL